MALVQSRLFVGSNDVVGRTNEVGDLPVEAVSAEANGAESANISQSALLRVLRASYRYRSERPLDRRSLGELLLFNYRHDSHGVVAPSAREITLLGAHRPRVRWI